MKNTKSIAIMASSTAIAIALFAFSAYSMNDVQRGSNNNNEVGGEVRGFQWTPWDIEWGTNTSEIIAIGTVESIENKVVDQSVDSVDPATGQPVHTDVKTPFQYVTIRVEEYLKDDTGQNADTVTFRDYANGYVTYDNGETTFVTYEDVASYKIGERALYFISDVDGELQSAGYVSKFKITGDEVQSGYLEEKDKKPEKLAEFKDKIKKEVEKVKE